MITGIMRLAKSLLLSDLNNIIEVSMDDADIGSFYGFTESDVNELMKGNGVP
jgi:hypothetical protein